MKRVIVIGACVAGLAAAARLQHAGYEVTLFEKEPLVGGKMNQIREEGFTFDVGPTIVMMPELYREVFETCGRNADDYIPMEKVEPLMDISFGPGDRLRLSNDLASMTAAVEAVGEKDAQGYFEYLALLYKRYLIAKDNFLQRSFRKPIDFYNPKSLVAGLRLHTLGDAYSSVAHHVKDDRLRKALAFQTLYIGISPFEGPSLYMIIPMIELLYGVWFMKGGMYAMAQAMGRLFLEQGGELRTSTPVERIVVENKLVGGGFGGKEDVSVQHIAVLAALKVGRPVKVKFSRKESIAFHPKRHYMEGTFTLGCDENGIFTGLDCEIYFDTGAYASLCGPVLERACTHSVGPYCYQNTDIRGYGYYTNNPPAGAFRGFGVCQSEFALESNINLLAEQVGISPWEIRYRNAIEPGKVLPNGQIADCSTALKETLEAVREAYEQNAGHAGIACAMKNTGVGVGLPDKGRARLEVRGGVVEIYAAASDIGQGCATVFLQILSETAGLRREQMRNMGSSSELAPDSGTTSGSRQTLITGEAVRIAAADLKKALDGVGGDLSALEGREFFAEFFDPTDKLGADKPNPKSHVAYGFATHVVVLDDDGRVKEVWAAHDSGKVVNPISIQGQIEGGVLMGLGYALTEDFPLKDCVPQAKFGTLGLMRADQIPDIHAIYVEKKELLPFAYGAKGIGEIATIPTAPAVQGAYYARDHVLRTALPMQDTFYRPASKGK